MNITDSDLIQRIQAAYNSRNWQEAYSSVYSGLTHSVIDVDAEGNATFRDEPIDSSANGQAVWLWVSGAQKVNVNSGAFSSYIRGYTELQYKLRSGIDLGAGELQQTSDDVARRFIATLFEKLTSTSLNPPGNIEGTYSSLEVPVLGDIGRIDASSAAKRIFGGDYVPWAGTVLFAKLGDSSFFKSWVDQLDVGDFKKEPGAYDLRSIAQATIAQKTAWSGRITLITDYSTYIRTQSVGATATADASADAQSFFERTYGAEVSPIHIGNFIFSDLAGATAPNNLFRVGTIGDDRGDKAVRFDSSAQAVHGGGGNDELVFSSTPNSLSPRAGAARGDARRGLVRASGRRCDIGHRPEFGGRGWRAHHARPRDDGGPRHRDRPGRVRRRHDMEPDGPASDTGYRYSGHPLRDQL